MSRSYRRPFAAITGPASAKSDNQLAHRGVRRKQKLVLKTCPDCEDLLLPHPRECPWNNNYIIWGRDGAQCYLAWMRDSPQAYFRQYYQELLRK